MGYLGETEAHRVAQTITTEVYIGLPLCGLLSSGRSGPCRLLGQSKWTLKQQYQGLVWPHSGHVGIKSQLLCLPHSRAAWTPW